MVLLLGVASPAVSPLAHMAGLEALLWPLECIQRARGELASVRTEEERLAGARTGWDDGRGRASTDRRSAARGHTAAAAPVTLDRSEAHPSRVPPSLR